MTVRKTLNHADEAHAPLNGASHLQAMNAIMSNAASSPLRIMQTLAQENLRFWAQRMHAYGDWAEALAQSGAPEQWLSAQNAFLTRAQQDYVKESARVAEVIAAAAKPPVAVK